MAVVVRVVLALAPDTFVPLVSVVVAAPVLAVGVAVPAAVVVPAALAVFVVLVLGVNK